MSALLAILLASPAVEAGNTAFWENDFGAAVTAYTQVTEAHPDSADAWYNLGTAHARAGALGPAVHALEQARLLDPGDEDTQHNLAQVRSAALAQALSSNAQRVVLPGDDDTGAALLEAISPRAAAWTFALVWVGFFLALAWWRRPRSAAQRTAAGFIALVLGLLSAGAGSLIAGQQWLRDSAEEGVVLEPVQVREGPAARYPATVRVAAGVKVRLRGADQGWRRIQLPDGSEGWLAEDQLAPLRRPDA